MCMDFKHHVIQYVIDIVTQCGGGIIELEKEKKKVPGKDKWETLPVIPLITLVGVNNCQTILHMSKIMIHYYSTDETINQFSIGYMINPSLKFKNSFITQVENFLSVYFLLRQ